MLKWFLNLISGGLFGKILAWVTGLFKPSTPIQVDPSGQIAQANAQADVSIQASYTAEFNAPEKKYFFDRFVDAVNRLVRPLFTYGILVLFGYAAVAPVSFSHMVLALSAVPSMLWTIMLTIIAFWFGSRIIEKAPVGIQPVDPKLLSQIVNSRRVSSAPIPVKPMSATQYQAAMKSPTPLPNSVILEWNRQHNPGFKGTPTVTNE